MKILFWVNCYGAWAPEDRSPVETLGYDQYLNDVVGAIASLKNRIGEIFISGGMYDKKGRTECETVKPELEKRLIKFGINKEIKTDEESVTSASIMKKFLTRWKEEYSDLTPVIFVDQVRLEVNTFTFEHFCKELKIKNLNTKSVIVPIKRLDDHPHSTTEAQGKKLKLMKERGIDYVENLECEARKEHILRKKK